MIRAFRFAQQASTSYVSPKSGTNSEYEAGLGRDLCFRRAGACKADERKPRTAGAEG